MCAIVDANVIAEIFGSQRPPAGETFFHWINGGNGRLVIGGKLLKELESSDRFMSWGHKALLAGKIKIIDKIAVNARTKELCDEGKCKSNDSHVIALAQVSGARLLYSNDKALQQDFKNKSLLDRPRGKVYSTLQHQSLRDSHKQLLRNKDLCSTG